MPKTIKARETDETPETEETEQETREQTETQKEITEAKNVIKLDEVGSEAELLTFFKSLGATDAMVKLHHKPPECRTFAFVGTYPISEFSLDWVRDECGGGEFYIQGVVNGKLSKKFDFSIAHYIQSKYARTRQQGNSSDLVPLLQKTIETAVARQTPQKDDSTDKLLMIMQQSADRSEKMFQIMMQNQQSSFTALATAFGSRPQSNPLEAITSLAPIFIAYLQNQKPNGSIKELIESLAVLKTLSDGGSSDGDEGKDDMFGKVGRLIGPAVGSVIGTLRGQPQPQISDLNTGAPPDRQLEEPEEQEQPYQANPPLSAQEQQVVAGIQPFTAVLVRYAQLNMSPAGIVAQMKTSNAQAFPLIVGILRRPDWRIIFFGNDSGVAKNEAWFTQLREAFLANESAQQSV